MSGIYIHIPFCKQKCIYCNFYSVANLNKKEAYIDALLKEISLTKDYLPDRQIDTLYFGGGTPSLCSTAELGSIVNELSKHYHFAHNFEFTIEANPEQLNQEYIHGLKGIGVNRLSIGTQSFQDDILKILHRRHSAEEAIQSIMTAAESGFDNISIDLIYDIAFRSEGMWRSDLETALALPVTHLSAYSLTVEENTLLAKKIRDGEPFTFDDELSERDFNLLQTMTSEAGFEQYEISNFAKDGKISRHNFSYWIGTPYLGLGAAAHSYDGAARKWNVANITDYITGINEEKPRIESEILTDDQRYDEYVLLRLRTSLGIDLTEVEKRFGTEKKRHLQKQIQTVNPKYYTLQDDVIRLSKDGKLFADAVAVELF